ncbi:MAG: cupin domain-containing protein [Alphaproteobacteria bacterium]|nr:cupin domain-containing protein [Alphaproteobacteria bacterium]
MRTLIEPVAVNDLPWEMLGTHGLRRKLLSFDPDTGRATQYVHIPENWRGGGVAHYHDAYEEVFVIQGDVTLNGRDYLGDGSYIYRPAGIVHGHNEGARQGCHCIIRTGGALELNLVHEPEDDEEYVLFESGDDRPLMLDLRTRIMSWERVGEGSAYSRRKVLSCSPSTGASTTILSLPAGWQGRIDLGTAVTWEWLILSGDARIGGVTVLGEAFGCRPAGAPETSIDGSVGGAMVLLWCGN